MHQLKLISTFYCWCIIRSFFVVFSFVHWMVVYHTILWRQTIRKRSNGSTNPLNMTEAIYFRNFIRFLDGSIHINVVIVVHAGCYKEKYGEYLEYYSLAAQLSTTQTQQRFTDLSQCETHILWLSKKRSIDLIGMKMNFIGKLKRKPQIFFFQNCKTFSCCPNKTNIDFKSDIKYHLPSFDPIVFPPSSICNILLAFTFQMYTKKSFNLMSVELFKKPFSTYASKLCSINCKLVRIENR